VGVLGESVRPPRCAMALTAGGGGTGIFVHGQRTRALGHGGAGCAAQSSGGLLLVVGTGQDRLRKYARVGDKEARSACGYHRDVERNFHIAVQKGSINFVTKGGRAYKLTVERLSGKEVLFPCLRIVSCLMRTLDYHSRHIHNLLSLLSRYSAFSTSRHKCYKSEEIRANHKQQARLGTETVQGATGTLQSIDDVERRHSFPMTKLRRCTIMMSHVGHTA
jgi:hypothetical protein